MNYAFAVKTMTQEGRFSGYASVFDQVDLERDIIRPGAFRDVKNPKMLWQHDATKPIGRWDVLREDAKGLYVEGQLFLDLPQARDAHTLLKEGALDGLSIGFYPVKSAPRPGGGREIFEVNLLEISLVTFPANEGATIMHVKQKKGATMKLPELQDTLQELKTHFHSQEEKLGSLEKRLLCTQRPEMGGALKSEKDQSFKKYLAQGIQSKGLTTVEESRGGYLVPSLIYDRILTSLDDYSPIRKLARRLTISTSSVEILLSKKDPEAGWVGEVDDRGETTPPELFKLKIPVHELYAKPKASQKLLDDASLDVENWLVHKVAEKMAKMETSAFLFGDGNNKPKGFLAQEFVDKEDWTWGKIEKISSGVAGGFQAENGADILIDTLQAMKSAYLKDAVWIMSRSALAEIRKLKDQNTGQYLWQPGLAGTPQNLLGYPVVICDEMPALVSQKESISVVFANLQEAYQIVDRSGIHILRDPYSAKPHVEFYVTKRLGGDIINYEAIKVISFS